mgnify:CR=1 FL=1
MREILFKAKRTDNSEWVEGFYGAFAGKFFICMYVVEHYCVPALRWFEIDPETLCEFAGRCDKNGKRIWENDILMAHLDESYPENVTYETIEWGFAGWETHEANSADRQYLDKFDLEHFEVVGNIFDNKELLQEESE